MKELIIKLLHKINSFGDNSVLIKVNFKSEAAYFIQSDGRVGVFSELYPLLQKGVRKHTYIYWNKGDLMNIRSHLLYILNNYERVCFITRNNTLYCKELIEYINGGRILTRLHRVIKYKFTKRGWLRFFYPKNLIKMLETFAK